MRLYRSVVELALMGVAAFVVTGAPRKAEACSPPLCWPSAALVPANGATVPANLPALYWRPVALHMQGPSDPARLFFGADATAIALTPKELASGSYELGLSAPLTPGQTYRFIDPSVCNGWGAPDAGATVDGGPDQGSGPPTPGVLDVSFTAGPTAPLPNSLGTLTTKTLGLAPLTVGTAMGSCDVEIEAARGTVSLQLAEEAKPWASVLHFETLVDGKPWHGTDSINSVNEPGASWRGRGTDLLYAICGPDKGAFPGVGQGSHQVVLRATLPGTPLSLSTPPAAVTLTCPSDSNGCAVASRGELVGGELAGGCLCVLLLAIALCGRARRRRERATSPH